MHRLVTCSKLPEEKGVSLPGLSRVGVIYPAKSSQADVLYKAHKTCYITAGWVEDFLILYLNWAMSCCRDNGPWCSLL